jgi:hypothetical protein
MSRAIGRPEIVPGEPPFFVVGIPKLLVMSLATFRLYEIYWFYQQWRQIKEVSGGDLTPVGRALFPVFFCPALFREVEQAAEEVGVTVRFTRAQLASAFIVLALCVRLPGPFWIISLLSVLPLMEVQRMATAVVLRQVPTAELNARLTPANWGGLVFGTLIMGVLAIGTLASVMLSVGENRTSAAFLSRVAAETNRSLPKRVDDEIQLVGTVGVEGVLVFRYSLPHYAAGQFDQEKLANTLRPRLARGACSSSDTRELLKNGVTLRNVYTDKVSVEFLILDITERDCGG